MLENKSLSTTCKQEAGFKRFAARRMVVNAGKPMGRRIGAILLTFCMLFVNGPVIAPAASKKANDAGGYVVDSTEDFKELARKCQDAEWSVGREVTLSKDISFLEEDFVSIPYFAGRFDGGGHKLGGISITDNLSKGGVFSETARGSVILNLTVEGTVMPGGSQEKTGGIVGDNAGKLVNCEFIGTIGADNETGGIAGHNQASGRIRDCRVYGIVEGIADIGGIVGINEGLIRCCANHAAVNTSQHEETVSEDQVTAIFEHISMTGELNSLRNTANITDIGGIAGLNKGTVDQCENSGTVGYQYVGYNIGGIAGRSSGLISYGKNRGEIFGRKDVGGIVGQLQPYLEIEFAQDELESLRSELDILDAKVTAAEEDARMYSAQTTAKLGELSALLTKAKNSANDIINGGLSFADVLTDQTNLNTGLIKESAAGLSSIMQELQEGINRMEGSADTLLKETQNFIDEAKMSQEDKDIAADALDTLQSAMSSIAIAGDNLTTAVLTLSRDLDTLQKDIEGSGWTAEKALSYSRVLLEDVKSITRYTGAISRALNNELIPAINGISGLVSTYAQAASEQAGELQKTLDQFVAAQTSVSESVIELTGQVNSILDLVNEGKSYSEILSEINTEDISKDLQELQGNMTDLNSAAKKLGESVSDLIGSAVMSDEDKALLKQYNETIQKATTEIAQNAASLQSAVEKLVSDIDMVQSDMERNSESLTVIKNDVLKLKSDCDVITGYITDITTAFNNQVVPALNDLSSLLIKYRNGPDNTALRAAVNGMMDSVTGMPDTLTELSGLLDALNEKSDTVIPKLDESIRESKESLYQSMLEAGSRMNALTEQMGEGSDRLTADLQEITGEFHDCMDLLIGSVQNLGTANADPMDHVEDLSLEELSEEEISSLTQGRVTDSINRGDLIGSLNLGGIVGTVGIESDLDPEKDIISSGNSSRNYAFQSKCIIDGCQNYGAIDARKNNLGGIVGLMNIGLITKCASYGDISSESGSYIGGLAGFSQSAVRNSFARGSFTGMRYIGGAVGYGYIISNVTTMVCIPSAEQEYGAIAGAVSQRDGKYLYGNRFVAEERIDSEYRTEELFGAQAGIGGISFPGIAEEISYEELLDLDDVTEEFRTMTLTFKAEDENVKVITCAYGDGIESEKLPEVPKKEGYTGEWDREDFSHITGDDTIRAIYSVEITTLASKEKRDGKQSVLLANGSFGRDAVLGLSKENAKEGEAEHWHVTLTDAGVHEYRFLPETDDVTLSIERDGVKTALEADSYGKYLTFETDANDFDLILETQRNETLPVWLIWVLLAVAVLVLGVRHWRAHRKGKQQS